MLLNKRGFAATFSIIFRHGGQLGKADPSDVDLG
jgi:hypothetical protein